MSMPSVWLFGGSVRAAARSLHLAGYTVFAADKFQDIDLSRYTATSYLLPHVEHALELIGHHAADAWLYTGGWENHSHLIEQLSQCLLLWGNHATVLKQIRNVTQLQNLLAKHDFQMPAMQQEHPTQGEWLYKSNFSVGGLQIRSVKKDHTVAITANSYFQAFIPGQVYGAAYIGSTMGAVLLGVSQQLMHCSWTNAPEFYYAGSVGPVLLPAHIDQRLRELGNVLVQETGLCGWFGVDFIIDSQGALFILEVNPRYTASIEVLERAAQCSTARLHAQACNHETLDLHVLRRIQHSRQVVGKAILYGKHKQAFPVSAKSDWNRLMLSDAIADIPQSDMPLEAGVPYCTLFATSATVTETEQNLEQLTRQVSQLLGQI